MDLFLYLFDLDQTMLLMICIV